MTRPTVFISYSWDSPEHQEWVLTLANDLISQYGVDVLLDRYEMTVGGELTHFMESSIQKADKVVMILTPNYRNRAEGRAGGVGYEYSMISQGMYTAQVENDKFIPVLRAGTIEDSIPGYIKTRFVP
jgi:hypothetical protein